MSSLPAQLTRPLRPRCSALDVVGGVLPVPTAELARRAYAYTLNPLRNPVKEVADACGSIADTPPMLGIFNDIPAHKFREDEAHAWARAGFSFIISDGEHGQHECRYGKQENAAIARLGMLPVQRLHREAVSEHGDQFQLGARATMRPYGTTVDHARRYLRSLEFPVAGSAANTDDDRGGYPVRGGDRVMTFTPDSLRAAETETQGWLQFETAEFIGPSAVSTSVVELLKDFAEHRGKFRACAFIGPFDAALRTGAGSATVTEHLHALVQRAAENNILIGTVCGGDTPEALEEKMYTMINLGARLVCVHRVTSDVPYYGAASLAAPFYRAAARAGF